MDKFSELKAAAIAGHKTCDCHSYNADDGSVPNVILEVPDNIRRYTDGRERACIDACIADAILHLWERGLPTLNSCCGHNKHEPQIIIPDVDFAPKRYFEALAEIDQRDWIVSRWERVDHRNKLSELSKPVAWPNGCNETAVKALRYLAEHKRPIGGSDMYNTEHLYMIAREVEIMSRQHLYSQEYVSALLADNEALKIRVGEKERLLISNAVDYEYDLIEMKRRAEAAEQRASELEAKDKTLELEREKSRRVMSENYQQAQRIAELEAKLATPVRLQSPWVDKAGNRWLLEGATADVIRASGFAVTVEGGCVG